MDSALARAAVEPNLARRIAATMHVKMPKTAKPAEIRRITVSMERTGGGMGVALVCEIIAKPAIAPPEPRMANRLDRIPTIAAATTGVDGPECFMG